MNNNRNITDVHMHVVPDVDDGSRSIEESIIMLKYSAMQGVRTVIATPHSWGIDHCGYSYMIEQYQKLKDAVKENQILIELYLGCEMLVSMDTVDDCVQKLEKGSYPTLAGSRYALTEFDPYECQLFMDQCIERLMSAGYIPVVAHVERYRKITMEGIRDMKKKGALLQINAYSIINEMNAQIREFANSCLAERLVDFIGSDAHRMNHRPPIIKDGIDDLWIKCTRDYAKQITESNPKQLLLQNK